MRAREYGTCCEVMVLALERQPTTRIGLAVETMMNMHTGDSRPKAVIMFRRAKRTDTGKYGHGKKFAGSTFAPVEFCPFCGTKDCTPLTPSGPARGRR